MGCGLRKMKPTSEESSPGKIYSTLKRPQVETKVGVAYAYRYLDFLIGKDGGTSTLRLSSVRELPGQLQELYQQGFLLAAVHPFIHPCGPESNSPQHQLYRAILVRLSDGPERSQPVRLQLEECLSAQQVPTAELIQGYVKKQIQDAADQGVMFVGFVQEPYGAPCTRIREPDTPSLSLHSSPSSVLGSLGSCSPSAPSSPAIQPEGGAPAAAEEKQEGRSNQLAPGPEDEASPAALSPAVSPTSEGDPEPSEDVTEEEESSCRNNKKEREAKERPRYRQRRGDGAELLALYNRPPAPPEGHVKYYTIKVPLQVTANGDEGVKGVEANWLDHMTQHFNNGASLVDGYFHLGDMKDLMPKSVESVFIFQEGCEGEANAAAPTYDAIVVEQWTIIDGLQVKADYIPLLQSLATFGWRLTCVLPTPVIKTNSDGSLSTKQIVFLQRPILGRKRRESKKLIFKPRGKSNKSCSKDPEKGNKNKKKRSKVEKAAEDPRIDGGEKEAERDQKTSQGEKTNAADAEEAAEADGGKSEGKEEQHSDEAKMDGGVEISRDDAEETAGGGGATADQEEEKDREEEKEAAPLAEDGEASATETVATVESQNKTKEEEEEEGGVAQMVVENGIGTDDEDEAESPKVVAKKKQRPEETLE